MVGEVFIIESISVRSSLNEGVDGDRYWIGRYDT